MHLKISVLGPPQISLNGNEYLPFRYDRVRALLLYLAVENTQTHSRIKLVDLLWPETSLKSGLVNLRQALSTLRRALDDKNRAIPFILADTKSISLNPTSIISLDVVEFSHLLDAVQNHNHRRLSACSSCIAQLKKATLLYRQAFLDGFSIDNKQFEGWMLGLASSLHERAMWALSALTDSYVERSDYISAMAVAQRQLQLDSFCESAHLSLLNALLLSGQRNRALIHYNNYHAMLAQELGIEPSAPIRDVYQRLLNDGINYHAAKADSHVLPGTLVPLVGYKFEKSFISEQLARTDHRLLTLAGPPGSGKSSVAREVAHLETNNFRDGVFWIDVSKCNEDNWLEEIMVALQLNCDQHRSPLQQLLRWLRDKELLLILDGFEELTDHSLLLLRLLKMSRHLNILVTSRQWLMLQEETVIPLFGLNVPQKFNADTLSRSNCAKFFASCMQRLQARFILQSAKDRYALFRLCHLVDGLPLALEYLAYWHQLYSLPELVMMLENGNELFTHTPVDSYQPINNVFDYAWSQLSATAQADFLQLSLFEDGFTRQFAFEQAGVAPASLMELQIKSFIRPIHLPRTIVNGNNLQQSKRFKIPEFLRHYALCQQPQHQATHVSRTFASG